MKSESFAMNFNMTSEDLKQARRKLGLTKIKLAKRLGVSVSIYRNWEQGISPVPGPVKKLIKILTEDTK